MSHGPFPRLGFSFVLLLLTLPLMSTGAAPPAGRAATKAGLSSLPIQAQASISAALGRDQRAYHAKREGRAWRLENPKHGLRADFTPRGVAVQSGAVRFGLRLAGLGRGARLEAVAAAKPEAKSNRIDYRRSGLSEWYVNGPLGLEQGFTLDSPPARKGSEALTLALRLSGDLSAVPDPRGDGLALQARGRTALRYRGLVAWDGTGRTLPAWWQGQGSEVRLRVDDSGARYPLTIDPIIEDARLAPSDGLAGDSFGRSAAVDGDTVVVGAEGDDVGSNFEQGSAYVFVRPVGGWSGLLQENAKLVASDGAGDDNFGRSVAVDGDTVVVGARGADVADVGFSQGAAYVFVRPATGWAGLLTEHAKLVASDGETGDRLGTGVAISGDTVAVRAPREGSAYVFVKPAGGWAGLLQESAKLVASDGAPDDQGPFSADVAVSGDTVVVGVDRDDIGPNSDQGSAYVFVKPTGGWAGLLQENAKLTASDGASFDSFGFSVGASGDTVVVGGGTRAYVFVEPPGG